MTKSLLLCLIWVSSLGAQTRELDRVLRTHVADGRVNYKALKRDPLFERSVQRLAQVNPGTLKSQSERLAFWINVYNAFTLKLIVDHYPVASINDLHSGPGLIVSTVIGNTVWKVWKFRIHERNYTLDEVEHSILRPMGDYRIHAAINCASRGCPPLRSEVYTPEKLNEQLDDQMRRFLRPPYACYDSESNTLYVSKVFDWFAEDFEKQKPLPYALLRYLPENVNQKAAASARIRTLDYDWNLNE